MTYVEFVSLAAFVVTFAAVLYLGSRSFRRSTRLEREIAERRANADSRTAEPLLLSLIGPEPEIPILRPRTELDVKRLRLELARAGFRQRRAMEVYLFVRLCVMGAGFVFATGLNVGLIGLSPLNLLTGVVGAAAAMIALPILLHAIKRRRQRALERSLPDLLDLVSIALASGKAVDMALREAMHHLRHCASVLAEEFDAFFRQMDLGRNRRDALHDLALRCGTKEMASFSNTLIHAHAMGTEIARPLADLAISMRRERRFRAEARASRASVTLLFPLILCIFPGVFVTLVGPAVILIIKDIMALG